MTYNPKPKNLPFLPGNVYSDPTVTRYHKTQLLGVQNGVLTGKCSPKPQAPEREGASPEPPLSSP